MAEMDGFIEGSAEIDGLDDVDGSEDGRDEG